MLHAQAVFVGIVDAHQSAWLVYGRSQGKSHVSHSAAQIQLLTSSLRHPKIFVKEFGDFLMSCHQHCLGVNLLVQR